VPANHRPLSATPAPRPPRAPLTATASYFRTGLYPAPRLPYTLGREAAGTVIAAGPSAAFAAGDRVAYLGEGAYAAHVLVPSASCVRVPDGISLSDAAAALLQGMTAWTLMHDAHEVKSGDWTLVQAAAGGVGQWLVQMLKFVGAKVVATCSTTKVELVKSIGADVVVDYTKEDYLAAVMAATGGAGVVAVFDGVGKTTFDKSLQCVARKGTMVSFGNASGPVEPFVIS
jgi:NADPH2:quinone reductase